MPTPVKEVDPFLDTDFAPLDTRDRTQHVAALTQLAEEHPELQITPAPVPAPTDPPIEEDQPEVFDVDGGTVTLVHDDKGWHGTLSLEDGGGDEVFHGKTQKELMTKVLAGKVKASAHIRKLNKKLKLGTPIDDPVPIQDQPVQPKQLNANDIFEIKTALEADPDKAFDLRFQKKYGMTEDQFVALVRRIEISARKGEEASDELTIESVSKEFLEANKNVYHPYLENGDALLTWLVRNKLKRNVMTSDLVTDKDGQKHINFGAISGELLKKGLYTVANLEEAVEDLNDSGLLTAPPEPELPVIEEELTPVPAAPQPVPVPVPQNPRIVAARRQARGGLGIRANAISTRIPDEPRAPSADELENLSTTELSELLNATYRHARSARR
jgi:hypothetical protein